MNINAIAGLVVHTNTTQNTVYEEHGILLYQRDCTMVAYGKIYFEA